MRYDAAETPNRYRKDEARPPRPAAEEEYSAKEGSSLRFAFSFGLS